eukprot:3999182-Prymnesium_polylepis.1
MAWTWTFTCMSRLPPVQHGLAQDNRYLEVVDDWLSSPDVDVGPCVVAVVVMCRGCGSRPHRTVPCRFCCVECVRTHEQGSHPSAVHSQAVLQSTTRMYECHSAQPT